MKEPNSFDYILATKLAAKTSQAYSYNRYGVDEWTKCIWFLLGRGYSDEAIVQILCSKTMRWAADRGDYAGTCDLLREYYKQNAGSINEMLVDECGLRTYLRTEETV